MVAGMDTDGDGKLDEGEIEEEAVVCNGADGADGMDGDEGPAGTPGAGGPRGADGLRSLLEVADATGCGVEGGVLVRAGLDANGDGVLQPAEVSEEREICNGTSGRPGEILLLEQQLLVGSVCPEGGKVLHVGRDTDGSGVLEVDEIESSLTHCNGCGPGRVTSPHDPDQCLAKRSIELQGHVSSIVDGGAVYPPFTVGMTFSATVELYEFGSIVDGEPVPTAGSYRFESPPARFTVNLDGQQIESASTGEIFVFVFDGSGSDPQDEYRVHSSDNAPLGALEVQSITFAQTDASGLDLTSDAMRAPIPLANATSSTVTIVFRRPPAVETATITMNVTTLTLQ